MSCLSNNSCDLTEFLTKISHRNVFINGLESVHRGAEISYLVGEKLLRQNLIRSEHDVGVAAEICLYKLFWVWQRVTLLVKKFSKKTVLL